ncbi:unnamed protein product [Spirodela intermedia]|uniref:Uncharacterized protein n=1 Tax=Spirodela intermedia TaxID=51605 RepID=A0A7I8LAW5_SPIIN|nr:unnamed protein product [Spirodela intermedia]
MAPRTLFQKEAGIRVILAVRRTKASRCVASSSLITSGTFDGAVGGTIFSFSLFGLQGPLRRVYHSKEFEDSETWVADCEGRAVTILYSSIGKDSILVIAWSSGQLQVDALADEVQPLWNMDSSPHLRVVVVTSVYECILLEMRGWKDMPPHFLDESVRPSIAETSLMGRRSTLHHYIKLFHENFVEYAHKVYVELKQHGDHLKAILGEQHARLQVVGESLSRLEDKQPRLTSRINRATEVYRIQERRLQSFKNLPGADRKPLSKAERELSQGRRNQALDSQRISQLKASMGKLSRVNDENVNKIKLIEQVLHSEEDDG